MDRNTTVSDRNATSFNLLQSSGLSLVVSTGTGTKPQGGMIELDPVGSLPCRSPGIVTEMEVV